MSRREYRYPGRHPVRRDEGDARGPDWNPARLDEALALHEAISVAAEGRLPARRSRRSTTTTALDGVRFTSRILEGPEGVSRAFPFVATCGVEPEEWSHSKADVMQRFGRMASKSLPCVAPSPFWAII